MKITVRLMSIAALSIGFMQITHPAIIMIRLVEEDTQANFLYAVGSMDENKCNFPNPATLTYKGIGGAKGVIIAFDNTLVNYLFVKESLDSKPYPLYGFNLKNTQTFQLGGSNVIVILRDGAIVYNKMENL